MGCCCSSYVEQQPTTALKFHGGTSGTVWNNIEKVFVPCDDINTWISELYKGRFTANKYDNWVVYNDQEISNKTSAGHCKGIVAWNKKHITWLIHSCPHFPRTFDKTGISKIDEPEYIYGQSFYFVKIPYNDVMLANIMKQLQIMSAHVYIQNKPHFTAIAQKKSNSVVFLQLTKQITHIAKPHSYQVDLYTEIAKYKQNVGTLRVMTWIRGSEYKNKTRYVDDINQTCILGKKTNRSQDHSKWAVNSTIGVYVVGDLNRMTTQLTRGGGAFIIENKEISTALNNSIML